MCPIYNPQARFLKVGEVRTYLCLQNNVVGCSAPFSLTKGKCRRQNVVIERKPWTFLERSSLNLPLLAYSKMFHRCTYRTQGTHTASEGLEYGNLLVWCNLLFLVCETDRYMRSQSKKFLLYQFEFNYA